MPFTFEIHQLPLPFKFINSTIITYKYVLFYLHIYKQGDRIVYYITADL
jgi:hypothetical protein